MTRETETLLNKLFLDWGSTLRCFDYLAVREVSEGLVQRKTIGKPVVPQSNMPVESPTEYTLRASRYSTLETQANTKASSNWEKRWT